jgi:hypothetical protein
MKQVNAVKGRLGFRMEQSEKQLLLQVLSLYPLIPTGHQTLSKTGQSEEDQKLLEEALAAQREENKKQLEMMLKSKSLFRKTSGRQTYLLSLKISEAEWLLQVLNDIRVGSWLRLGSPDRTEEFMAALSEQTAPYFWAMEVSGHFQMVLVHALSSQPGG